MIVIIYLQLIRTHVQCCTVFWVNTENLDYRRSFKCFLWRFHPNCSNKSTYTNRQLSINPPNKKWRLLGDELPKKNEWLVSSRYFCPGDIVVEEVEASVRMPWHLKRMWTSVWDLGDDLLRMDMILGLRRPWELSGKIVITISVGALHEPSWFMIHCYTAAAGPKTKWGFGSIPSRMPVANEGLGSDAWA